MYGYWTSYLQALKTKPLRTNTLTALVITGCGDILAQSIERDQHHQEHPSTSTSTSAQEDHIVRHHLHHDRTWQDHNHLSYDISSQDDRICWKRNQIVSSYWCLAAPFSYYWFRWLDSRFPIPKVNARGLLTLSKKLTLHVGVYRTTVNTLFYGWLVWFNRDNDDDDDVNHKTVSARTEEETHSSSRTTHQGQIQASSSTSTFMDQWMMKLQNDFMETQKTSVMVWGCAQTINFLFLPTHTRVLFTSFVSVFWSAYLSFIGHRRNDDDDDDYDTEDDKRLIEEGNDS